MEKKPESVKQTTEREQADSGWVLRPDVSSGTSIELTILTKANQPTPEMLELLQRLMVRVQESEAAEGPVLRNPPDCEKLKHCGTYKLV